MTVLPRRGEKLRRSARQVGLEVRLGPRRLTVPLDRVVEVAPLLACTPVPSTHATNLGIAYHRGRLLALVDAAARLTIARPPANDTPPLCVVVKTTRGDIGFPCDEVLGFTPLATTADAVLDVERLVTAHG